GEDEAKALHAVLALAAVPRQSLPRLGKLIPQGEKPDPQRLTQLVKELDSDVFVRRAKAMELLEKAGTTARDALQKGLAGQPSLEARKRMEYLLDKLDQLKSTPARRHLCQRAVLVLERVGTKEAREMLQALQWGTPDEEVFREVEVALERLKS